MIPAVSCIRHNWTEVVHFKILSLSTRKEQTSRSNKLVSPIMKFHKVVSRCELLETNLIISAAVIVINIIY